MKNNLNKLWKSVKNKLELSISLIPESEIQNNEKSNSLRVFWEYIDANELELALDEIESIGNVSECTIEFWIYLYEAAELMKLKDHQNRYRNTISSF